MERRASIPTGTTSQNLTYAVRIWKIKTYEGKRKKTYAVRWQAGEREHYKAFGSRALADQFRADLLAHTRKGSAFDTTTGLPEPMLRQRKQCSWYELACRFVDTKWPSSAPGSRRTRAEALTTVTPAFISSEKGSPPAHLLRKALYKWSFVTPEREAKRPPNDLQETIRWLERKTIPLSALEDSVSGPELMRKALDSLASKLDGTPAAPNTIARKRTVFYGALQFAVEIGMLSSNPIHKVSWTRPKPIDTVDRRTVVNADQARRLLSAVEKQSNGRRLVAFFACMYYAALRPAEALALRVEDLSLPETGWGELLLSASLPRSGTAWTDTGTSRQPSSLKHRPKKDTRHVPAHPELVQILKKHVSDFSRAQNDRLFTGERGGLIDESTYLAVWHLARKEALTPSQARSPLAKIPYHLRHAAVSTWLNAGVPPTQVAQWAGHSVEVLLRTYAKCIVGQDELAKRRIEQSMNERM